MFKKFNHIPKSKPQLNVDTTVNPVVDRYIDKKLQQGLALHKAGQSEQAEVLYKDILIINPKHFDALQLSGILAAQAKQWNKAFILFTEALRINTTNAALYNNRGTVLYELQRLEEALVSYNKAIELKRNFAEAYYNRGKVLHELKRLEETIASYDKAIEFKSDYAEAYSNRGNVLHQLKSLEEALLSYNKAIEFKSSYAVAYYNRGNVLNELKCLEEALVNYDKAIEYKPNYAEAYHNRGIVLHELKRLEEALVSYNKAIALKPDYTEAYSNRGVALQELKQFDAAFASFDKAIVLKPDYADAYFNRGLLKLTLRDFYSGFLDFKYRWDSKDFSSTQQKTKIPSASRSGLKGHLLIWPEQGIGDEVFYAGLLPMLSKKDVSIALSADKRLHSIYRRSFPNVELLDKNILMSSSVEAGFDAQAPIGDLGFLLDIKEATIKETRSPYLQSDTVKRDNYRRTIAALGPGLVCGVAWKSGNTKLEAAKSIGLDSFAPLLGLTGVNFVNLQYGDVKGEIQRLKSTLSADVYQVPGVDVFNDIESLLALIDACDVIVTTSNVTAHLAGSIGKRAAVLVPHSKGKIWYWHENDEYSFWYPSLKLFYQDNALTWDQTIEDCSDWVRSLL